MEISKIILNFAKVKPRTLTKTVNVMDYNIIYEQIERLEQEIRDYLEYARIYNVDEKTKDRRIDMYLDDYNYLKQQLKQN